MWGKIEDVSQNCFVLDVVKFKKLQMSRRIVSFLMLSASKNEEVSQQNRLVFKLADRQVDRETDRRTDRQTERGREREREIDR